MAKLTLEQVIKDFKKIHGEIYNYSKVNYFGTKIPVIINCKIHGDFKQQPLHHKRGSGCPLCYINGQSNTKSLEEHLKNVPNYQKELYNYNRIIYKNNKNYFKISCKICNYEFEQIIFNHKSGSGCPKCSAGKKSKVEKRIIKFLEDSKVNFEFQKTFEDCRNPINNYYLYYDFYLSEKNICIEFDGQQHFYPNKKFGGDIEFEKVKNRDKLKNEYCKNKNINLFRIRFDENIEEKLKDILNG